MSRSFLIGFLLLLLGACGASRRTAMTPAERNLRYEITDLADNYVGTKYVYGGKTPTSGFDCSGFTSYVYRNFDVSLPPSSRMQESIGEKIRLENAQPGDLIFFRRSSLGKVFHVAMVYSNDGKTIKIIHSTNRGVVIDDLLNNSYWAPKVSVVKNVLKG